MALQLNKFGAPDYQTAASPALGGGLSDFNLQCLRVLRCTAIAMANSPGGLRFKTGKASMRPWLEGISLEGISAPSLFWPHATCGNLKRPNGPLPLD